LAHYMYDIIWGCNIQGEIERSKGSSVISHMTIVLCTWYGTQYVHVHHVPAVWSVMLVWRCGVMLVWCDVGGVLMWALHIIHDHDT